MQKQMTSKKGIRLLTNGKYCAENIEVVPANAANIVAGNIKSGVEILGVTGTLAEQKPEQTKTVTPTAAGLTVTPDTGKVLSSVAINGDANLVAGNVKKNVTVFGVTGTFVGTDTSSDTVTANKMLLGTTAHDASGDQVIGEIDTFDGHISVTENQTLLTNGKYVVGDININVPQGTDVSEDTVTAAVMRYGYTAHNASGVKVTGTIADYAGDSEDIT